MIRFLIMLAIGYGVYRSIRSLTAPRGHEKMDSRDQGRIDDVMIKDPVCEVYLPQREALQLTHKGREYYFCSQVCLDKFKQHPIETGR